MFLVLACAMLSPGPSDGMVSPVSPPDSGPSDTAPPDEGPTGVVGTLVVDPATLLDAYPTVNYRGVDAAWDSASGTFLVVYGNAPVGGALVDVDGAQVGGGFRLTEEEYDGANWTQNPRVVALSSGFLVSWHREFPEGAAPQVRSVAVAGGAPTFGEVYTVGAPGASQESPVALTVGDEGEVLAVWAQDGLRALALDPSGAPRGKEVRLTAAGGWVEMPALAWHPGCACAFVTWMSEADGGARVSLLRLSGTTGEALGAPIDLAGTVEFAKVTDIAYDPTTGEVVATWYQVSGGAVAFAASRFGPEGDLRAGPEIVFAPYGSYDGYDLSWSSVTGTGLAAFHGPESAAYAAELGRDLSEGAVVELDSAGAVHGFFLPRVVAHPAEPAWMVVGSPDYAGVAAQWVRWE